MPATQLVLVTQPPLSIPDGTPFTVIAFAEDANGNQDTTFNGQVTVSLQSNPAGSAAVLAGTLTTTASAGQAAFSNLTLNKAGVGYALQLASTGVTPALTPTTTIPFTITPRPATQLAVTPQFSGDLTAGNTFGVVVTAVDANGNTDPNYTSNVTLSLLPGGRVPRHGGRRGGPGNVHRIVFDQGRHRLHLGGVQRQLLGDQQPIVRRGPRAGEPVAGDGPTDAQPGCRRQSVHPGGHGRGSIRQPGHERAGGVSLSSSSPLGGTTTATTADGLLVGGVATFTNLTLSNASVVSTIQATSPGLIGAISNPITVTPGKAAMLVATTPPPSSVTADVPFSLVVSAEDSVGNLDPTYGAHGETATISGTNLSGTLTVPFVSGVATFSNLILTPVAANGYTFALSSTNQSGTTLSGTAGPVNVVAAAATQLQLAVTSPSRPHQHHPGHRPGYHRRGRRSVLQHRPYL